MAKSGFFSQMKEEKRPERDQLIDESKQADIEQLGDCLRALGEGQSMGNFSFTVVLNSRDLPTVTREMGEFAAIFTNADGALFNETYNQLNALFATVPGNYVHNLRKLLLLNSNYADLSFLFTIHPGERTNAHLGAEYLAVLETDNATPYFLNLHNGEVAHTLITGMTGSGKSFLLNFLVTNAQKYRPQTYVFDIGGSFESLTEIFGGTYLNVGQESQDFTINPFSLEPTKENLQFLASFFRVLIEGDDERFRLDYKETRKLWDAIGRMYTVPPEQRTVSTFANIHWRPQRTAAPLDEGWAVRLSIRQRRGYAHFLTLSDVQFRRLGRCHRRTPTAPLLCSPSGGEPNRRPVATRHLQSLPHG
jgi:type IV secretion system protein VirB4